MLSARKTFHLVTFRNSSEQQNDNSLFPSNFKGKKKITVAHFTTTTHNSELSPGFFRALTEAGERKDQMCEGGSRISILSSMTRTGCNKIIYFRHSHMGPQLYQDQSEVQLPRKNRFPLASSRSDQLEPNPNGVYPRSTKP